jgi:hypothetical protein
MSLKRRLPVGSLFLGVMLVLSGCAGYGKLVRKAFDIRKFDTSSLRDDRGAYEIYTTRTGGYTAYLLDPKEDPRTLVAPRWHKVGECSAIAKCLDSLSAEQTRRVGVYAIFGPDGAFFGYLVSPRQHIIAKKEDENTLMVLDFSPPPSPP